MSWENLDLKIKSAFIASTAGIIFWVFYYIFYLKEFIYYGDIPGLAFALYLVVAIISLVILWLLGLLIGWLIGRNKKYSNGRKI